MRPRGVAFAIESLVNLNIDDADIFQRLERVTLAKIDEFIPHYLVKILSSYKKIGKGSSELYDQIIHKILINLSELKYSDTLKFFEIYPEVTYIFDNSMSSEIN
jgi:hypothetical protein